MSALYTYIYICIILHADLACGIGFNFEKTNVDPPPAEKSQECPAQQLRPSWTRSNQPGGRGPPDQNYISPLWNTNPNTPLAPSSEGAPEEHSTHERLERT